MLTTLNRLLALAASAGLGVALLPAALAQAQSPPSAPPSATRLTELPTTLPVIDRLRMTTRGRMIEDTRQGLEAPESPAGVNCQQLASHESSNFQPGTFALQGGIAQGEVLATSYTLPANAFPIKIDLIECLFGTSSATTQTITQYTVIVWDGTPDTGTIVAQYSSDDQILSHMRIGPGTAGLNLQISVDPTDPAQIYVENLFGSNTFSVGIRIDRHNRQTANACTTAPLATANAFPATDNTQSVCGNYGQLAQATRNYIFGLNCGPNGCPANNDVNSTGAWSRFSNLAADLSLGGGLCLTGCRPRGDWVLRATWESVSCQPGVGACCFPIGTCAIALETDCLAENGLYRGDGASCATANCPQPTGACCFGNGCVNLTAVDCGTAGGTFLGNATSCAVGNACPIGACCLPNGTCTLTTSASCNAASGLFRGVGTTCATANCPPPTGACCLSNGGCLVLTSVQCAIIPQSRFAGGATTCPEGCAPDCTVDFNDDGIVEPGDLDEFITAFFSDSSAERARADFNADGITEPGDLDEFITAFFVGC
ncbi:MAG: hypothetical protein ACT4PL_08230 [Phycisphaerales bacterium]